MQFASTPTTTILDLKTLHQNITRPYNTSQGNHYKIIKSGNNVRLDDSSPHERSIIVHGCDQWTLYSEENFQGNKTCTDRKPDMIADCRPYFYEDSVKLNAKFGTIKSAKKGCVL